MDRPSAAMSAPLGAADQFGSSKKAPAPKRSFSSRLFGYDIFISFALGPPPRGTHSYASDLARRLREHDFTVFFSEDEASPGDQLDSTLRTALYRSKVLVVIANRSTLEAPRWVRAEVEEFRRRHPDRPVIAINVDGALLDPALAANAQEWLEFRDRIWLDETEVAIEHGIASASLRADPFKIECWLAVGGARRHRGSLRAGDRIGDCHLERYSETARSRNHGKKRCRGRTRRESRVSGKGSSRRVGAARFSGAAHQ